MDGDDTLEYGKAQYTEADIIPCSGAGEDQGEAREREALRGAVLKYEAWTLTCVECYERTLMARLNICLLQWGDALQQNNAWILQVGQWW